MMGPRVCTALLVFLTILTAGKGSPAHAQTAERPRVGIIGAGAAGLLTAWLLEENYAVTLLEKEARVGGHADTVHFTIDGVPGHSDAGAAFVIERNYPILMRLLQDLRIPTRPYSADYCFFDTRTHAEYPLPPFEPSGSTNPRLYTDFQYLALNLQLFTFVNAAQAFISRNDHTTTLTQFISNTDLAPWFRQEFLYPFLAVFWGVPPSEVGSFEAHAALLWITESMGDSGRPTVFQEIAGGFSQYTDTLASQLTRSAIYTQTEATRIRLSGTQYLVTTQSGHVFTFDHLVIATNARQANELLAGVPATADLQRLLGAVEYFKATIAIHGDTRYLPRQESNWGVVNVRFDGRNSTMTTQLPWNHPSRRVFKTWITQEVEANLPLPSPLYAIREYWHPKLTPAYTALHRGLAPLQGRQNLWLAGMYTQGMDNHESALRSAVDIAQRLAPGSTRLRRLMVR